MKQLCLIGTVGNNLAVVQIPTGWSVEEAKSMLEMALKVFNEERENKEFVTVSSEEEPPADGRCVFHVEGARCRLLDKTERIQVYIIPNTKCRKRF